MIDTSANEPVRAAHGCGWVFFVLMLLVGSLYGSALGAFAFILDDPETRTTIQALEEFRPKIGSRLYSADGELLGEFTIEQRQVIPLAEMPLHLLKAFIATEDDIFYTHKGVRIDAIVNAFLDNLQSGRSRGGSTITQQVVRNVEDLNVGLDRTLERKIREAIVALQVERQFTKDEILELYLNQIFLGISAHGVEAAAQQYFAKSCAEVTLGEAATLAGLTRSPNRNNPIYNITNAKDRRDIVLAQMLENQLITREEHDRALEEDLAASVVTPEERAAALQANPELYAANRFEAPYFVEEVRRKMLAQFGKDKLFEDGLEIHTTVDMRLQRLAEASMFAAMDKFDEDRYKQLEARGQLEDFVPVTGALVCLDNREPYQGYIRAMVGGRDFDERKFNNATQALRQPGSSFKPFVWAAGIDNGMTPSTIIVDAPFERVAGNGAMWRPQNFDLEFHGPMTIRHALEKSVNIVAIKIAEQLGMPLVRSYIQRCGITTPISNDVGVTIALGTPDVLVIDMATAYSTFPNLGVRYDPMYVTEVQNRDGLKLYDGENYRTREENALDPAVAYVMVDLLRGACTPDPSIGYYPTGNRTEALQRPRGGKTGTTNQNRNVWFCGFTPEYTCVVWIGYSDNRPLGSGTNYTGGRMASPVWTEFMIGAHEGLPITEFKVPDGVTFHNIDRLRGTAGGKYKQAYVAGTAPPSGWTYAAEETPENLDAEDEALLEVL
jgi:penicillin-binding protein 1A